MVFGDFGGGELHSGQVVRVTAVTMNDMRQEAFGMRTNPLILVVPNVGRLFRFH